MLVTKRNRSIAGGIASAVLASTALMNFPFISADSASRTPGVLPARASVVSSADGSGPLAITPALDTGPRRQREYGRRGRNAERHRC